MSDKLTVQCLEFKPIERGTLTGFAKIAVKEMRLVIHDVALHEKNDKRWAQLPSKAQISKDRELIKDGDGKIRYAPVIEFESRAVADAFSDRVVSAVDAFRVVQSQYAG